MKKLDRRALLRAAGVSITLPIFESLLAPQSKAMENALLKTMIMYFPHGVVQNDWLPDQNGYQFSLKSNISSLEPHKSRLIFPKGLYSHWSNVGTPGDHAPASANYLTNLNVLKHSQNVNVGGMSADQKMANFMNTKYKTPVRLMNLSADDEQAHADRPSGYAKPNGTNISWRSATQAESRGYRPQTVFNTMFGGFNPSVTPPPAPQPTPTPQPNPTHSDYLAETKKSILDSVVGQIQSINSKLAIPDRVKMDQFLTGIREVEQTIQSAPQPGPSPTPSPNPGGGTGGSSILDSCRVPSRPSNGLSVDDHTRVMMDMAVLALACGRTTNVTYILLPEATWRRIDSIGISNLHDYSHYNAGGSISGHRRVTEWYAKQFAYLLSKMKQHQDGQNDLLYNSMVAYGCGIRDSDRHDHNNLPVILAGEAGGAWKTGRSVNLGRTPLPNLWLTMMKRLGMPDSRHGSSSGTINLG